MDGLEPGLALRFSKSRRIGPEGMHLPYHSVDHRTRIREPKIGSPPMPVVGRTDYGAGAFQYELPHSASHSVVGKLTALGLIVLVGLVSLNRHRPLNADHLSWETADYYETGNGRVSLRASETYYAIPVLGHERALQSIQHSAVFSVERSELLDAHGIALLKRTSWSSDEAIARALDAIGYQREILPVYTSAGIELLLRNDFAVQLSPGHAEEVVDALRQRYPSARFRADASIAGRYHVSFTETLPRAALHMINEISSLLDIEFAAPDFLMILPREDDLERAYTLGTFSTHDGEMASGTSQPCKGAPDDPLLMQQWSLDGDVTEGAIDVRAAWTITHGSRDVIVGILDDGVDFLHPDLAAKRAGEFDAVGADSDASPKHPLDAHGTASAGVAAAVTNNCAGMAGVAWEPQLYGVRVLEGTTHARITKPTIFEKGVRKAVAEGARILSIGLSGGERHPIIDRAIDHAITAGATLVLPAGNRNDVVGYPARLSAEKPIIAVAATNRLNEIKRPGAPPDAEPWGSNLGPEITIAAPGVAVLTTDIRGDAGFDRGGDYYPYFNGTSAAAASVAGVAALILSMHPGATSAEIRCRVVRGAVWVQSDSIGRLNARGSLEPSPAPCEY